MWALDTRASGGGPGHQALSREAMTVTPQEGLLPKELLVEATPRDHPEMVRTTWVDVLCRDVCGIQGRVVWGLHKSQHSCRRTSGEQPTWGRISTNLLPNGGNQEQGARRSSLAPCPKWAGLGAPRSWMGWTGLPVYHDPESWPGIRRERKEKVNRTTRRNK